MKTKKKALLLAACAVMLVAVSVLGTLAYLQDKDQVVNTFTVGNVDLKLDEAPVDENGQATNAARVQKNEYHLLPGHTYDKDPTVTVCMGSEESYVRMLVTFSYSSQLDAIFGTAGADLTTIFGGYKDENWKLMDVTENTTANTRTYEFWYVGSDNSGTKLGTVKKAEGADIVLDNLFESITVPTSITNEQLATLVTKDTAGNIISQFTITVVAHAIQADGFDDAAEAWSNFVAE